MKFFVTGGAGFIGSHLVDRVLSEGDEVVVYDNFDDFYQGKEKNLLQHEQNYRFSMRRNDVLDFDALLRSIRGCDAVLHLAAQPGVHYSLENPRKTILVNTVGTLNVLEAARISKPRKIVVASSSSVYGVQETTPVAEDASTKPISVYGATKLAAENYCIAYVQAFDLPITILRFHTVYGPRQRPDMAIAKWFRLMKQGEKPVIYGNGEQRRDFTYVQDIVEGVWAAVTSDLATGQVINLGSGSPVSIGHVLRLISSVLKVDVDPIFENPRPYDPPETHADLTKAKRLLSYRPKVTIEEGIRLYEEWLRKSPDCT